MPIRVSFTNKNGVKLPHVDEAVMISHRHLSGNFVVPLDISCAKMSREDTREGTNQCL